MVCFLVIIPCHYVLLQNVKVKFLFQFQLHITSDLSS